MLKSKTITELKPNSLIENVTMQNIDMDGQPKRTHKSERDLITQLLMMLKTESTFY